MAEAVQRFLGPKAELVAVTSTMAPVEHVVVKFDGKYIDADGAFTKSEMLTKMRDERVTSPQLVPFSEQLKKKAEDELICPSTSVHELVALLKREHCPVAS